MLQRVHRIERQQEHLLQIDLQEFLIAHQAAIPDHHVPQLQIIHQVAVAPGVVTVVVAAE